MPAALRPDVGAGTSLRALAAQIGAVAVTGDVVPELSITGLTLRAQDVQPGDLFAALPGATTHGARFVADAVDRGAAAVLTDGAGVTEIADSAARMRLRCRRSR